MLYMKRQLFETVIIKVNGKIDSSRITKLSADNEGLFPLETMKFADKYLWTSIVLREGRTRNFHIDGTHANKLGINDVLLTSDWNVGRDHVRRQRVQSSHYTYQLGRNEWRYPWHLRSYPDHNSFETN